MQIRCECHHASSVSEKRPTITAARNAWFPSCALMKLDKSRCCESAVMLPHTSGEANNGDERTALYAWRVRVPSVALASSVSAPPNTLRTLPWMDAVPSLWPTLVLVLRKKRLDGFTCNTISTSSCGLPLESCEGSRLAPMSRTRSRRAKSAPIEVVTSSKDRNVAGSPGSTNKVR